MHIEGFFLNGFCQCHGQFSGPNLPMVKKSKFIQLNYSLKKCKKIYIKKEH